MNTPRVIRLNGEDNVVIAIDLVNQGDPAHGLTARQRIHKGHKMAIEPIREGEPVRKFNQIIGFAKSHIAPGEWVHEHNVGLHDFARDYRFAEDAHDNGLLPEDMRATFEGYRRPNGRAGTRNYIGILTSVNCSASVARFAAAAVERSGALADYPEVDGIVAIVHGTGCGHAAYGEGFEVLRRTQWGYASHPNFAGVVMVGLGCEVFQIGRMKKEYGLTETDTFRTLTIQETGGTKKTVEAIAATIRDMLPIAARAKRETRPPPALALALQCGGSDGYSAITANPALGAASDLLVRHGGTSILSETPEIYGAEHLLTRRAATRAIGEKLVARIKWWEDYTARNGGEMNNNPSTGNKAGGLTTILEKSLGAAAKGGTTNLAGVYKYAEPIDRKGFVYMDSPGYDPASATGQVASGGNVIAFTTGRGSCFGFKPTPSLKIATNTAMYRRMADDMDINAGTILDGAETVQQVGGRIFDLVVRVAGGEKSKSEELGMGDNEFVPWQIGAVM